MDFSLIIKAVLVLSGMAIIFGLGLGFASVVLAVKEDPNIALVRGALPGANCGACGFTGCDSFAEAVVQKKAPANGCPVGGKSTATEIGKILGIKVETSEKQVAFIKCKGSASKSKFNYDYVGINDCHAIMQLAGGSSKSCTYGCMGGGSCVNTCDFGAIQIKDGIAEIDKEKCTACTLCTKSCPKLLIEMVPYNNSVFVACNSNDKGKAVRANCSVGCIGCGACVKACEFDAIHMDNSLAKIDYSKCTMCNACTKKCPTKAIYSELDMVEEKNSKKISNAV